MPVNFISSATSKITDFTGTICCLCSCHLSDECKEPKAFEIFKKFEYANANDLIKKLGADKHAPPGEIEICTFNEKPEKDSKSTFNEKPEKDSKSTFNEKPEKDTKVSHPTVILMFCRLYAGSSMFANDNIKKRLNHFKNCIDKLLRINDLYNLAFDISNIIDSNKSEYLDIIKDFEVNYKLHNGKTLEITIFDEGSLKVPCLKKGNVISNKKVETIRILDISNAKIQETVFTADDLIRYQLQS